MSRTRGRAPTTTLVDNGEHQSRKFVSVQNDAYQEDFLRQNLAPGPQNYSRSPSGHQAYRVKNPRTREGVHHEDDRLERYEENPHRSSQKKAQKIGNHNIHEETRHQVRIVEAGKQDSSDQERVSRLNLSKLGGQQGKVEIRFIADSFRGDIISERQQKPREPVKIPQLELNKKPESHDKIPLIDLQYDELMNHYQELLEFILPQTLRHFLKTPTLYVDIVGTILLTINDFVDQKIKETLEDLARVLGIDSKNQTLLDILIKYPDGLSHLQPKEEDHIVGAIFTKVSKLINTDAKIQPALRQTLVATWEKLSSKRSKWAGLLRSSYSIFYILKFKIVNYKFPLTEVEKSVYTIKGFSKEMILPRLEELKGLSTFMRVLPGIGIYNSNLELEMEVGPYYLPISVESIAFGESVAPSLQSGPQTLREISIDQLPDHKPNEPSQQRRRIADQRSEGKFTFEGNPNQQQHKVAEKASTVASSSYQYFLMDESSRHEAETANFEKRNIPREFSAAAVKKREMQRLDRSPKVVDKQIEPPRFEGAHYSKDSRSKPREQGSRSKDRRPDPQAARTRYLPERGTSEASASYFRRKNLNPERVDRDPESGNERPIADRSTSRARAAHYLPLDRPRKESAGELFSPLGEQECNEFIKLNTSSEKPKRRESVLDRIEKEILKRESEKGIDAYYQPPARARDRSLISRTDPDNVQKQRPQRIAENLQDDLEQRPGRAKSRSAHRERSQRGPSYAQQQPELGERPAPESGDNFVSKREANRPSSRVRLRQGGNEGEDRQEGRGNDQTDRGQRDEPPARRSPGSGSRRYKREPSPQNQKLEQVLSTDFMRHESSGNLLTTMSPVHSSLRHSLKSKKHD